MDIIEEAKARTDHIVSESGAIFIQKKVRKKKCSIFTRMPPNDSKFNSIFKNCQMGRSFNKNFFFNIKVYRAYS